MVAISTRQRGFWTDIHASSVSDEWETPPEVFAPLQAEFGFTLDAAASPENAKCRTFFTKADNALVQDWGQHTVWLNCPYGRGVTGKWLAKAYAAAQAGATVVCLVPSRTDTRWFHAYATKGEIRFLPGRITFQRYGKPIVDSKGKPSPAPFPSMVVIFRPPQQKKEEVHGQA